MRISFKAFPNWILQLPVFFSYSFLGITYNDTSSFTFLNNQTSDIITGNMRIRRKRL